VAVAAALAVVGEVDAEAEEGANNDSRDPPIRSLRLEYSDMSVKGRRCASSPMKRYAA
jgi:hypothetical protein